MDPRFLGWPDGDQRDLDPEDARAMQYVLVLMGLWFLGTTVTASWTVFSSARALPAIADAVKGDIAILADSGIRNGLDVVRMIALGADTVLLGRAFLYALATAGQAGVANLLNLIEKEMKVAMTLTGAKSINEITQDSLVQGL